MSEIVIIQEQDNEVIVDETNLTVSTASDGPQGPQGPTGATGATGAAGSSGVVAVTAPITNSGTSSSANIGIDLSNIAAKYAPLFQVKYRSGYWYESRNGSQILTSLYSLNRMLLLPVFIPESITLDRIAVECTAAVASSTFRLGIYNSDVNGEPSTLLLDAGTVSTASIGLKAITISQSLSAGLYYLAYSQQGGATNATRRAYHNVIGNWSPVASTTQQGSSYVTGYNQDSVTGAFPSTFTSAQPNTLQPCRVQFRVA